MTNQIIHLSAAILLVLAALALAFAQVSFFYSAAESSINHLYTPLGAHKTAANPADLKRATNQIRDAPTRRPDCTKPLMECQI